MGLACSLFRATAADIERLIATPEALDDFLLEVEGPPLPVREVRPKGLLGLLLRLTPIRITEVVPESERGGAPPERPPDPDRMIDIDKAWHGLHVLLTGTATGGEEPACYLSHGGTELDDEGFSRALRPEQARRFAEFLGSLTPEDLRQRFDAQAGALGDSADRTRTRTRRGTEPSAIPGLLSAFTEVQTFLTKVAAAGDGVIIRVC